MSVAGVESLRLERGLQDRGSRRGLPSSWWPGLASDQSDGVAVGRALWGCGPRGERMGGSPVATIATLLRDRVSLQVRWVDSSARAIKPIRDRGDLPVLLLPPTTAAAIQKRRRPGFVARDRVHAATTARASQPPRLRAAITDQRAQWRGRAVLRCRSALSFPGLAQRAGPALGHRGASVSVPGPLLRATHAAAPESRGIGRGYVGGTTPTARSRTLAGQPPARFGSRTRGAEPSRTQPNPRLQTRNEGSPVRVRASDLPSEARG